MASGEWEGRPAGRPYEWRVASGKEASGEWRVAGGSEASGEWRVASGKEASGEWRVASGSKASGEWRVEDHHSLLAIHDSLLAARHSRLAITRRQMRQALRRAGQEGTDAGAVAPFVNLPPEVWPDFRRLREIETALAAGQMPPPDAGAGNRAIPRTVPARLPEAQPRTDPPGITGQTTGRTAGSEPPARHPFPEAVRHE